MGELSSVATLLQDYGAHGMASIFAGMYFLERRERRATQEKLEELLVQTSTRVHENALVIAKAVQALEKAFIRAGIDSDD